MEDVTVRLTLTAGAMLSRCPVKTAKKIIDKIDSLKNGPMLLGKPLKDSLDGFRSIVAAGRFRIIYHVAETDGVTIVTVVAVGQRKEGDSNDVYRLADKMAESGELLE